MLADRSCLHTSRALWGHKIQHQPQYVMQRKCKNEPTSDERDIPITTIAKLCMTITDRRPIDKTIKKFSNV